MAVSNRTSIKLKHTNMTVYFVVVVQATQLQRRGHTWKKIANMNETSQAKVRKGNIFNGHGISAGGKKSSVETQYNICFIESLAKPTARTYQNCSSKTICAFHDMQRMLDTSYYIPLERSELRHDRVTKIALHALQRGHRQYW